MKSILITGASGFIGRSLCEHLSTDNKVTGTFLKNRPSDSGRINLEQINLADIGKTSDICKSCKPDVVIHCAGIAHQKVGSVNREAYFQINSHATEILARASVASNPDVLFIYLSSISVYGENNLTLPVAENHYVNPTSDYGLSKLDAESRLIRLSEKGDLRNLIILRPAPVYDREWRFNLDRRVLFPGKLFYMKFGSGIQEMSALARPNLVDFVRYLIDNKGIQSPGYDVFNVCDKHAYTFKEIIEVFRRSSIYPVRPTVRIPLFPVYLSTRFAGVFVPKQRKWFHACYEKLASSLIFDNRKMLETGFIHKHSLKSIFRT